MSFTLISMISLMILNAKCDLIAPYFETISRESVQLKPTQKSIIIEPIIDYVGNDGQNLIYSLFTPNISEEKDLMSSDSMQMKTISQPKFIKNSRRFNKAFGTEFSDAFSSFGKSFGSGFGTEFSRGYKNNNKNKKFGNTFKSKSNARLFGSNLNIGFKPFINVFRNLNK